MIKQFRNAEAGIMKQPLLILSMVLLMGFGLFFGYLSLERTALTAPPAADAVTNNDPAMDEPGSNLFPVDDGYAAAIFFGGETLGSLKDCGCPKNPQGGLIWRMGYSNAFAKHSPTVPTLQVDAGYFFSDARDGNGQLYPYIEKQNEWVLNAYSRMEFAVANLTHHDLPYAEALFEKTHYDTNKNLHPILGGVISANVRSRKPGYLSPQPTLIRELSGQRIPGQRKLRVGFVGLTDPQNVKSSVFAIEDPLAAAQRVIPELRSQCDVLVVLAYLPSDGAERLAREVPGIDLIVNANQIRSERESIRVNQTTIAFARYQTKSLGEALIYLDKNGRLADIRTRLIPLDGTVPRDAKAEALVSQAETEITKAKQQFLAQREEKSGH